MKNPKTQTDQELEDTLIDVLDEIYLRQSQFISVTMTTTPNSGTHTINLPRIQTDEPIGPGKIEYVPPPLPEPNMDEFNRKLETLNKATEKKIDDVFFEHNQSFQKLVASLCLFTGIIIIMGAVWPG